MMDKLAQLALKIGRNAKRAAELASDIKTADKNLVLKNLSDSIQKNFQRKSDRFKNS